MNLLWLVPALPFAGFLLLSLARCRLPRSAAAAIGVGSVGLSALVAFVVFFAFRTSNAALYSQTLWTWFDVAGLSPGISLYLDALSAVMMLVVTGVGFLIHVYSIEYMRDDESFARFFAYMNLFVGCMLVLVLADNLVLLYLGWEGVGLCSYLLIGFWYRDPANGSAARKAFVVTRVGDTAMAIGLFLLFWQLGTLQIQPMLDAARASWPTGSGWALAAALLLLGGAVGKSGQLPLQVWLPDAMAGPTPVSALIHAATMVTAGVYLIARTHVLFQLAPTAQFLVGLVGALTLLIAAFAALAQTDIKRILAYSTISQIGYMFLGLGVGAWSAAMFHFMTHAFFKALLFMGAGAIILACHHEQNIFKMGGLRKKLPATWWTFLAGAGALAALPLVTAGFYSKDMILWHAWAGESGNRWLWAAGFLGAFLTAIYTFRMLFIVFFGEAKTEVHHRPGRTITVPLAILAVLSLVGGFLETPHSLGHVTLFSHFMSTALPHGDIHGSMGTEILLQILTTLLVFVGIGIAYRLYLKEPQRAERLTATPLGENLRRFFESGLGFDALYNALLVKPFYSLAALSKADVVDFIYTLLANMTRVLHYLVSFSQSGHLRWYAAAIGFGALIVLGVALS